ncbi:ribonuclease H-like protein [Rhizoclosmatium globosum]|uniref:3'-5' exonuclease n=1 Tax=Rhizoclosmatium globosum TaxID=329046 RepID=A0A1Y2BAT9_9FUNG|nr:ribonuclease H-like protein [Rhizoclosmatium globosum]|eukprot:ORY31195.1 ribonuclease H-like protein [Rhizoclosmatium globosum]
MAMKAELGCTPSPALGTTFATGLHEEAEKIPDCGDRLDEEDSILTGILPPQKRRYESSDEEIELNAKRQKQVEQSSMPTGSFFFRHPDRDALVTVPELGSDATDAISDHLLNTVSEEATTKILEKLTTKGYFGLNVPGLLVPNARVFVLSNTAQMETVFATILDGFAFKEVGLDCEFANNSLSTIQIAFSSHIVVICQFWHLFTSSTSHPTLPPCLLAFLLNVDVIKTGVSIGSDCKSIKTAFGIEVQNIVDIGNIAKGLNIRAQSLRSLYYVCVHTVEPAFKGPNCSGHDWRLPNLSEAAVKYGANDAIASLLCYRCLKEDPPLILAKVAPWDDLHFGNRDTVTPHKKRSKLRLNEWKEPKGTSFIDINSWLLGVNSSEPTRVETMKPSTFEDILTKLVRGYNMNHSCKPIKVPTKAKERFSQLFEEPFLRLVLYNIRKDQCPVYHVLDVICDGWKDVWKFRWPEQNVNCTLEDAELFETTDTDTRRLISAELVSMWILNGDFIGVRFKSKQGFRPNCIFSNGCARVRQRVIERVDNTEARLILC